MLNDLLKLNGQPKLREEMTQIAIDSNDMHQNIIYSIHLNCDRRDNS